MGGGALDQPAMVGRLRRHRNGIDDTEQRLKVLIERRTVARCGVLPTSCIGIPNSGEGRARVIVERLGPEASVIVREREDPNADHAASVARASCGR